jgi:acyl carrier protein
MLPTISNIRRFILTDILNDPERDLTSEQDLLLSGILDSLGVVRLISWLESECQITIPAQDVIVEHFGSLNQIRRYLDTRAASQIPS